MTRRRVLCGLLLVSVVLACFTGWLWSVRRPRANPERFGQIKEGMSREEVIRIVGGPPFEIVDVPEAGRVDCWLGEEADDAALYV